MPKLHRYINKPGHYIKSAFEETIITYQVTPKGEAYLQKKGWKDNAEISVDHLLWMQQQGYIYTGGSGPGEIESSLLSSFWSGSQRKGQRKGIWGGRKKRRSKKNQGCGCCALAFLFILLLPFTLVVFYLRQRSQAI